LPTKQNNSQELTFLLLKEERLKMNCALWESLLQHCSPDLKVQANHFALNFLTTNNVHTHLLRPEQGSGPVSENCGAQSWHLHCYQVTMT
jgi:hypothetical protein